MVNSQGGGSARLSYGDRVFESLLLRRRVRLASAQPRSQLRTPRRGGGLRVDGDVIRDGPAANRCCLALFLCRALMQSHLGKAPPFYNDTRAAVETTARGTSV